MSCNFYSCEEIKLLQDEKVNAKIKIMDLEIRVKLLEETMQAIIKASPNFEEPISVAYAKAALNKN